MPCEPKQEGSGKLLSTSQFWDHWMRFSFMELHQKTIHQQEVPANHFWIYSLELTSEPFLQVAIMFYGSDLESDQPFDDTEKPHWCTQTLGQFSILDSLLWFVFVPCVAARPFVPAALHRLPAPLRKKKPVRINGERDHWTLEWRRISKCVQP